MTAFVRCGKGPDTYNMTETEQQIHESGERCRGTASLLSATLISDSFFKAGVTPGGYTRNDMNSVCYVQIGIIAPVSGGTAPGPEDFAAWKMKASSYADMLERMTVKKTSVDFYLVFVVDPACRTEEGERELANILSQTQRRMEEAGLIADTVEIDPEKGTWRVVSGRKIENRYLRSAVSKTLASSPEMSGAQQYDLARRRVEETGKKFRSLESGGAARKGPGPLMIIIAANVLIFAAGSVIKMREGADLLAVWGIQDNALIFQGQWWRLLTSMFLHADIAHLSGNMLLLFMLGRSMRRYYTDAALLIIYFSGGMAGNILGLLFSDSRSLGASGAILGLGGALLYRMTLGKNSREFRHAGDFTWLALTVIFNLLYGLFTPGIDNYGHFGGFIGGFIAALVIGTFFAGRDGGRDGRRGEQVAGNSVDGSADAGEERAN